MHVVVRPPKAGDSFYPLNTDGGLSIAAWVELNDNTAAARCIASASSGGTLNWAVYASNASGNVEAKIAGATYSTTTSIRDGQQHHVLVVYDATPSTDTVKIAVDGVQVLSVNAGAAIAYSGTEVTMEAGRNTLTGTEALNGIVDDLRWWNDPVEAAYWPTLVAAEQIDHQLAIYPFDHDTAEDFGSYGHDLTVAPSASFTTGLYGRCAGLRYGGSRRERRGRLPRLRPARHLRLAPPRHRARRLGRPDPRDQRHARTARGSASW